MIRTTKKLKKVRFTLELINFQEEVYERPIGKLAKWENIRIRLREIPKKRLNALKLKEMITCQNKALNTIFLIPITRLETLYLKTAFMSYEKTEQGTRFSLNSRLKTKKAL
jgi:hypothetical protein